jgi:2-iminobutanoate/2-iminopropanoate deaminase
VGKRMKAIVQAKNAPKPVGPYSQAVKVGNFLFVSGQLAIDPKLGKIVAQDITGQTRQVVENIKAILEAANYDLKDVVQTNVYLSSMMLFKEFNVEYSKYFDKEYPARATIGVELTPNALVEISAIACKE